MGTRGLTVVKVNGETKVAQYGQWDHYPSGQGADVFKFLRDARRVSRLRENAATLRSTTDADDLYSPHLSRDMGAEILEYVASGKTDHVTLDIDFLEDTIFNEGVFEVDLDKNTFSYWSPVYSKHSGAPNDPYVVTFEEIWNYDVTLEQWIQTADDLYDD